MAEKKRQFNCLTEDETLERIEALKVRVAEAMGLRKVSAQDVLRMAMIELEKKYPSTANKKGG